jgi:hypothetical protein
MRWTRRLSSEVVDANVQRYTALVDRRQAFVSGLRELERELEQQPPAIAPDETAADWVALAGYNWAQQVRRVGHLVGFERNVGGRALDCVPPMSLAAARAWQWASNGAGTRADQRVIDLASTVLVMPVAHALQEGEDATPEKLKAMLREALEQTSSPGGCRQ